MMRKSARALALLIGVVPAATLALGLGNVEVSTMLNEPLRAEIPIGDVQPGQLGEIEVRLGTEAHFRRAGLERPFHLSRLKFKVVADAEGKARVEVTTRESVTEPFLNFLVELNWPNGRVVREYTLLLDPPDYGTVVSTAAKQSAAAAEALPEPVQTPAPRAQAQLQNPIPTKETTTAQADSPAGNASEPSAEERASAAKIAQSESTSAAPGPAALTTAALAVGSPSAAPPRAGGHMNAYPSKPPKASITQPAEATAEMTVSPAKTPADLATASASTDLIAARLAVTRQWLEQADGDHYSIQLLLTPPTHRRILEGLLERQSLEGRIEHVYVYETAINKWPYFSVLYGEFSGYSAAKEALENLPPDLKRLGPFIRNVSDITPKS